MDDLPNREKLNFGKLCTDDLEQLRMWSNNLGVSQAELKRVVAEVGGDLDKIRAYLNTRA